MTVHQYILEGKTPVLCKDLLEWASWFENADRTVAKTKISKTIRVSTIFLGLDHNYNDGPPVLFETMVFGGELDQEMDRYSTWEEAEAGHTRMVEKLR